MRLGAGIAWWMLFWAGLAGAQELPRAPDPPRTLVPDKPSVERTLPGRLEETEPALYYLKDKQGQLQAVPGFSFETFVDLYKLKNQLEQPEARPVFTVAQLTAGGAAVGDRAELTVQVKIRTEEARWTRVPLRLDQAVLREPAQYEGKGKHFVHYQAGGEGYVAWIEGPAQSEHVLTLKVLVPLVELGDTTRLKLFLPRATAGEVKLTVPLAGAAASVAAGTVSAAAVTGQEATELTVLGPGGDLELSWRAADARSTGPAAALEVVGTILARIDGRSIDSEATLTVRSYGEPFDRFGVRLPREAELVPHPAGSYTVSPRKPAKGSNERLVEVRLPRPTAGPVEVQLTTRRRYDAKSEQWLELGGFEVPEASRQWGHVAVAVVGDWQVLWGPSRGMQRVDQWPERLRYEDVVAGFEYFAQPATLGVRLVPRKTYLGVEPEYVLLVDPDQVKLEAKLRYTIRGAKAFKLDVNLGDWQFDAVEPDYLVSTDAVSVTSAGMLTIPLQQPTTGQVELVLRARRAVAAKSAKLSVSLPQPQVNSLGPAALVVLPADNLELVPDSAAIAGLTRQQVRPSMPLPERQQAPLFYRGEASKAVFAADLVVHPRSVSVEVASQVAIGPAGVQVEQKLSYAIAHEPLERLILDVPRALAVPEKLAFEFQGQALAGVVLPGAAAEGPVHVAVTLPRSCLGSCELVLKYSLGAEPGGGTRTLRVPLVMPAEGNLRSNKLSVTAPPEMSVQPADAAWTPVPEEGQRAKVVLSAAGRVQEVPLAVAVQAATAQPGTFVERLWIQTWLTQSERQDRAVFRLVTDKTQLPLDIPEGAAQGQMLLLVDGQPATLLVAVSGELAVPLPGPGEHTVELRYFFPGGRPARGLLDLKAPHIAGSAWSRRAYWQVVLPPNEHILATPPAFTREYEWGWEGYFWGRRPVMEQAELETWSGASRQESLAQGTNRYLFSTMGKVDGCEVRSASRSSIVLLASGVALVAGLLLIHVPAARHPTSLLVVAAAVFGIGMIYPEPMLLVSQATGLGLALAIVAGLLERAVARRRKVYSPAKSVLEKGSTEAYRTSPSAAGQASTQSAPPAPPATLEWDV